MWPIQFLCLFFIVASVDLSSPTIRSTSSFDMCSVQLIFSILRHNHISKASNLLMSSFLIFSWSMFQMHIDADAPYRRFDQTCLRDFCSFLLLAVPFL